MIEKASRNGVAVPFCNVLVSYLLDNREFYVGMTVSNHNNGKYYRRYY
ncbi:MAG: hypothetical protein SPL42_05130 [Bacteroidales bacterium]|nr:hypothetical protein [Bacteroidales bacterium]MDY6347799.1 hypothetical protein [Bacteroidales bacterium]